MKINLEIIGIILIILALIHIIFPRYFNWKEELDRISLVNKQMMVIHTFFIGLIVMMMGILCLSSAQLLLESILGKRILLGFAIFWSIRLVLQFWGYSSELWRGKRFETTVHIAFSILWLYLTIIFWIAYTN